MCVIVLTLCTDSSSSTQSSSLALFHFFSYHTSFLYFSTPPNVCVSSTNISLPLFHSANPLNPPYLPPPTCVCFFRLLSSRTTPTSICAVLAMERQWSLLWSRVPKDQKQPRSRVQMELPSRGVNMHVSQYAASTYNSIPEPCPYDT